MRVHFHRSYDHRWPSRAMTHFPAGWEGPVKKEVAEAAIGKQRATVTSKRDSLQGDAARDDDRSGILVQPDHRESDGAGSGGDAGGLGRNAGDDDPSLALIPHKGDVQ